MFALSQSGASSSAARWMANRENAADLVGGVNVDGQGRRPCMRALLDMSTTAQIKDSLKLGGEVLGQIGKVGKLHKGSVEQAGFAVLKAPDIPSILVEIGVHLESRTRKRSCAIPTTAPSWSMRWRPASSATSRAIRRWRAAAQL